MITAYRSVIAKSCIMTGPRRLISAVWVISPAGDTSPYVRNGGQN